MRITRASHTRRSRAGRLGAIAASSALIGLLALNPLLSTAALAQPEPRATIAAATSTDPDAHAADAASGTEGVGGTAAADGDTRTEDSSTGSTSSPVPEGAASDGDASTSDIDGTSDKAAGNELDDAIPARVPAPQELRASDVASIDGVGYATLADAMGAAVARMQQGRDCTITVHQSTTFAPYGYTSLPAVPAGGHLTIEAAAGTSPTITLESGNAPSGKAPLFTVQGAGASLTVRGLTLAGTSRFTKACFNRAIDARDGATVTIENTTITGFAAPADKGSSLSTETVDGSGAAIRAAASSRVVMTGTSRIENCGFETTTSAHFNLGGAVYVDGSTFEMHDDATIDACVAFAAGAVMVTNRGAFTMDGNASITNTRNFGTGVGQDGGAARGGAVYVRDASTFIMDGHARIENCSANDGVVAVGRWSYNKSNPDDNSTFTMRGNATVSNNEARNFGIVSIWGTSHATIGGNATLQSNRIVGDKETRLAGTVFMDAVNHPKTEDDAHPTLTVTDNACISNNAIGREDGRLNLDITSASAIGSRRCTGTITINGNAHIVDNTSYSGLGTAAAVTVYEGTTLKLGGNAVVANNKNPNSPSGCGIFQWTNQDYGRIELSGAPTVTGNTGKNGRANDLRLTRRDYAHVTGDLTGGSIGVTASFIPLGVQVDSKMDKLGNVFGFTTAASAAGVQGLEHIFNNDDPSLRGGAGVGSQVIWARANTDPGDPDDPTPPQDPSLLRIEKHVRVDGSGSDTIDRTHAFAMDAVLDAPWRNVKAVVYNADGTPATDKNGKPVEVTICAYGGGDVCLPGDEYGCGSQTLIQFKLADGQYLLVSGIAQNTAFRTRETDPQVKNTPNAVQDALFTPSETLDGASYTSQDARDATLVSGTVTGTEGNPTAVAYTNTATIVPPTGIETGSNSSATWLVGIGVIGAAGLAGSRAHARRRRR